MDMAKVQSDFSSDKSVVDTLNTLPVLQVTHHFTPIENSFAAHNDAAGVDADPTTGWQRVQCGAYGSRGCAAAGD